ncbi:MAG TPA: hypothetical protein VFN59_07320, partial [Acidimicrobiales bacterium]|nr:hypothetical protein [Acidimicrobiales bacterium]
CASGSAVTFADGVASASVTLYDAAPTTLSVSDSSGDSGQVALDVTPGAVRGLVLAGVSVDTSPSILAGCSGPVGDLTCVSSGEATDHTVGGQLTAHLRQVDGFGNPVDNPGSTSIVIDVAVSSSASNGTISISGDGTLSIAQGHASTTNNFTISRTDGVAQTMSVSFTIDGDGSSPILTVTLAS